MPRMVPSRRRIVLGAADFLPISSIFFFPCVLLPDLIEILPSHLSLATIPSCVRFPVLLVVVSKNHECPCLILLVAFFCQSFVFLVSFHESGGMVVCLDDLLIRFGSRRPPGPNPFSHLSPQLFFRRPVLPLLCSHGLCSGLRSDGRNPL